MEVEINTNFEAAATELTYDLNSGLLPRPTFVVTRRAAELTDLQETLLREYAEWVEMFPCSKPLQPGRSVVGITSNQSLWHQSGIHAVKGKGIAGIYKGVCTPPSPQIEYDAGTYHFLLTNEMRLKGVLSAPKALNCLAAKGADKEFDCDARLDQIGIGWRPLLAGHFIMATNMPETDLFKTPTGAVFLGHRRELVGFNHYMDFLILGDGHYLPPTVNYLNSGSWSPKLLIDSFIEFAEQMAATKIFSCIEGDVFRHASHPGNFTFEASSGKAFMHDTDTCLLGEEISETLAKSKGVQLLRDLASSTVGMIQDLSLCAHSNSYYALLASGQIKPFCKFFSGLFKEYANPLSILRAGEHLQQDYIEFIETWIDKISPEAQSYRKAIMDGNSQLRDGPSYRWKLVHNMFLAATIVRIYDLMLESKLQKSSFWLPKISTDKLVDFLNQDVSTYTEQKLKHSIKPLDK